MENMGKLKLLKGKNSEELCKIVLPPLFTFVVNSLVYWGAPLIVGTGRSHNLSGGLDELVPFMPAFIIIHFGCYIFCVVNYLMVAFYEDENKYRFYTADFYARLICLAFFVLFPTTNTRPELTGNGIFIRAMRFLYTVDKPVNLFPSIHCMASWFCCIGLRKCKEIPEWYKLMSVLIAISVFISTLATRQHVLWDVAGGIGVAELTWFISNRTNGWKTYQRLNEKISVGISRRLGR